MAKQQGEAASRKGPSYPYYSWTQSLKVADAVKSLGGDRAPVTKGDIAHHLAVSEDSQSLIQNIASARTFGMIAGHGEYTLTETGRQHFYPDTETDKRAAELAFLCTPPAYRMLVERFDGNILPPPRNLGTMLQKFGVPVSWVDRVASQFKDACERLGLFDGGGHLRYGVAVRSLTRTKPPAKSDEPSSAGGREIGEEPPAAEREVEIKNHARVVQVEREPANLAGNVWSYSEAGGMLRVETPNPLPRALWERLKRYVEILEPPKEEDVP